MNPELFKNEHKIRKPARWFLPTLMVVQSANKPSAGLHWPDPSCDSAIFKGHTFVTLLTRMFHCKTRNKTGFGSSAMTLLVRSRDAILIEVIPKLAPTSTKTMSLSLPSSWAPTSSKSLAAAFFTSKSNAKLPWKISQLKGSLFEIHIFHIDETLHPLFPCSLTSLKWRMWLHFTVRPTNLWPHWRNGAIWQSSINVSEASGISYEEAKWYVFCRCGK